MIQPTMAVAAAISASSERATFARAARWRRARAIVIDTIVFGFISLVVNGVYGVTHIETFPQITIGGGAYTTGVSVPLQMLLGVVYFLVPEAMFGATLGKWWTRLKVVRLDGRPLEVRDVVVRNVLRIIDYQPTLYLVGGLFVGATRGSQRLGDLAAGTTVIGDENVREPGETRTSGALARRILAWSIAGAIVFTFAFDYFGRPPLVVEGLFNQQQLVRVKLINYSLGAPTWAWGSVSYPLTGHTATQTCAGSIRLDWEFPLGWVVGGSSLTCLPS